MSEDATDRRLLVLDDDRPVAVLISTVAGQAGFEARSTHEVGSFFALLDTWRPTHVMIDLVMPETDGVEVLAGLAKCQYRGMVYVASGLGGRTLATAGRAAEDYGLNLRGLLSKPFSLGELRALLTGSVEVA
jgi:DNA-binding response OmpR family regulator